MRHPTDLGAIYFCVFKQPFATHGTRSYTFIVLYVFAEVENLVIAGQVITAYYLVNWKTTIYPLSFDNDCERFF